ncbi:MAG: aminodeoxychorismate synthase component I [Planctomycetota bacterium]|nr:aminodeoxychorismate synthase component I [Planctomycetota bacterium]
MDVSVCSEILTARVVAEPIALAHPPGGLLELLAERENPAVLESAALHKTYGRYSLLSCLPVEVLTLRQGVLRNRAGQILASGDKQIWTVLADRLTGVRVTSQPAAGGYVPGWIGYVGYEVGRHIERLPAAAVRDTPLPDLRLAMYDAILVYDSLQRRWSLVKLLFDHPPPGAGRAAEALREIIAQASPNAPEPPPEPTELADAARRPGIENAEPNFTPAQYRRAVARCVDYIAAGDIFQVNLSQRFTVHDAPDPLLIYQSLRRRNPAWYAAYMTFESSDRPCAVLSSSPELFLRVRGDHVITRPIKGTRPRVGLADADAAASADLLANPKDNAELAMIIDLLRNDLGRVCRFGSVRVSEPRRLETHPTVFHLVGTVEGRLQGGAGCVDLLKATFPGGSITGAPKIRAMEIIDELEPQTRSVYTGCIGHIGADGSCELNIAIRTIVCDGRCARVQVGGGIVADSTPDGEYAETLDKARAMLEAIEEARRKIDN